MAIGACKGHVRFTWPSVALSYTQRHSVVISGHQRLSVAISRHQRQSELIMPDYLQHHLQPKSGERFAISRRVPEGGEETRLVW